MNKNYSNINCVLYVYTWYFWYCLMVDIEPRSYVSSMYHACGHIYGWTWIIDKKALLIYCASDAE